MIYVHIFLAFSATICSETYSHVNMFKISDIHMSLLLQRIFALSVFRALHPATHFLATMMVSQSSYPEEVLCEQQCQMVKVFLSLSSFPYY